MLRTRQEYLQQCPLNITWSRPSGTGFTAGMLSPAWRLLFSRWRCFSPIRSASSFRWFPITSDGAVAAFHWPYHSRLCRSVSPAPFSESWYPVSVQEKRSSLAIPWQLLASVVFVSFRNSGRSTSLYLHRLFSRTRGFLSQRHL